MTKRLLSTFEREMQDITFREEFEKEYNELLLSETILAMMNDAHKSVRKLATETDLSPTVIQNIRSGMQEDIKLSNFINISHACGYRLILEKDDNRITL
jgi:mRNA-degrading endonuclease RelE of RelBE toxin-antitoxin system